MMTEKARAAVEALRVSRAGTAASVGARIGVVELDATLPDVAAVMTAADTTCDAAQHDSRSGVWVHGMAARRLIRGDARRRSAVGK